MFLHDLLVACNLVPMTCRFSSLLVTELLGNTTLSTQQRVSTLFPIVFGAASGTIRSECKDEKAVRELWVRSETVDISVPGQMPSRWIQLRQRFYRCVSLDDDSTST